MKKIFLTSFAVLILAHAASITAAQPPAPDSEPLLLSIQDLGIELHEALRCDLADPEAPLCPMIDLSNLRARLDDLSEAVETVEAHQRQRLEQKLQQLRGLLHNLQLLDSNPAVANGLPENHLQLEAFMWKAPLGAAESPSNDGCSGPLAVGLETVTGDTGDASNDGEASCGASADSPDVWFLFTVPFDGLFFATSNGSGFDTVISSHSGCPGTAANQIDCNDDSYGLWSSIRIEALSGEQVLIRLAGAANASGSYQLTVESEASIGGRITADDGGAPIADVTAKIFNGDGGWIGSDISDATGDYLVTGLGEVEYFVATSYGAVSYLHELHDEITCPWGVPYDCEPTDGTPVVPTLGQTSVVDFELDEESVISGVLSVAAGGSPLDGWVHLFDEAGNDLGSDGVNYDGLYEFVRLEAGSYRLAASNELYIPEVWNNVSCPGPYLDSCDPLTGDLLPLGVATTLDDIDFELADKGAISGVLTEAGTGLPIAGVRVEAVDGVGTNYFANTEADGSYTIKGLWNDNHQVFTDTLVHLDELYDGLPCEPDCDPTAGTPVAVTVGATTTGIDFDLTRLGSLSGMVAEAGSGDAVDGWVSAYNTFGNEIDYDYTNPSGFYLIDGLLPGNIFVLSGGDDHVRMLYDGIPCPFDDCDPTDGTPVSISLATTTDGIDFALEPKGGISGVVREAASGQPLDNIWLWAWHSTREVVDSEYTNSAGEYTFPHLPAGTYFVVSNTSLPYLDQLYDGLACYGGPPEGCDPTKGTPIAVVAGTTTDGIDLDLLDHSLVVFIDGFESGFTGAWSFTSP